MKRSLPGEKPTPKQRRARLQGRLLKYSAAAGAAMASGQQADAAVQAQLNQNIMVTGNDSFDLDLDGDGTSDLRIGLRSFNTQSSNRISNVGTYYTGTMYTYATLPTDSGYDSTQVRVGGMRTRVNSLSSSFRTSRFLSATAYASVVGPGGAIATTGALKKSASSIIDILEFGGVDQTTLGQVFESERYSRSAQSITYQKQVLSADGATVSSYQHPDRNPFLSERVEGPYDFATASGEFIGMRGFLGVLFMTQDDTEHHAWVDVEVALGSQEPSGNKITIHGWAYEDIEGLGIHAGSTESLVPEPSGLAALATGAAGVAALRRNRRKQAAEAQKAE